MTQSKYVRVGTFLGYRDKDGNEMHCAHAKCLREDMCRRGCTSPIAKSGPTATSSAQNPLAGQEAVERYSIEHDGFTGTVIGHYRRLDGYEGVVMQQDGTKIVHVYGKRHLKPERADLHQPCRGRPCEFNVMTNLERGPSSSPQSNNASEATAEPLTGQDAIAPDKLIGQMAFAMQVALNALKETDRSKECLDAAQNSLEIALQWEAHFWRENNNSVYANPLPVMDRTELIASDLSRIADEIERDGLRKFVENRKNVQQLKGKRIVAALRAAARSASTAMNGVPPEVAAAIVRGEYTDMPPIGDSNLCISPVMDRETIARSLCAKAGSSWTSLSPGQPRLSNWYEAGLGTQWFWLNLADAILQIGRGK